MVLTKEEINALIDQKIREHEFRIGLISGIAGLSFLAATVYCLSLLFFAVYK